MIFRGKIQNKLTFTLLGIQKMAVEIGSTFEAMK